MIRVAAVAVAVGCAGWVAGSGGQTAPSAPTKVLRFARLWDGTRVIPDAVVIVSGNSIVSVGSGKVAAPPGSETIDLGRYTGLPGLIDAHTHITYFWDGAPGTTPFKQPAREAAERVRLAEANGRRTLETGVTTARDLGASGGTDIAMRDLINSGQMAGPRLFVSGQGISAGRGGSPDVETARKTAEARLGTNADWVKVY